MLAIVDMKVYGGEQVWRVIDGTANNERVACYCECDEAWKAEMIAAALNGVDRFNSAAELVREARKVGGENKVGRKES